MYCEIDQRNSKHLSFYVLPLKYPPGAIFWSTPWVGWVGYFRGTMWVQRRAPLKRFWPLSTLVPISLARLEESFNTNLFEADYGFLPLWQPPFRGGGSSVRYLYPSKFLGRICANCPTRTSMPGNRLTFWAQTEKNEMSLQMLVWVLNLLQK